MYTLKITTQFKKDLKRIQNNRLKMYHLKAVLEMLIRDGCVPNYYKPHKLAGEYNDFMKCHVENDLLLIWINNPNFVIKLVRLGKHSELFE